MVGTKPTDVQVESIRLIILINMKTFPFYLLYLNSSLLLFCCGAKQYLINVLNHKKVVPVPIHSK